MGWRLRPRSFSIRAPVGRIMLARTTLSTLLFGFFAVIAFSSCKKPEYPQCKKDKHCKQDLGEKCVDGSCQNCTVDTECVGKGPGGTNWVCSQFRCMDPSQVNAGGGSGEQGAPCTQPSDCFGGLVCRAGTCEFCQDNVECAPRTCTMESGRCSAEGSCTADDQCAMDQICDAGMCIFSGDYGGGENACGLDAIFFAFDSDKLTPSSMEALNGVLPCLTDHQGGSIMLEAHADNVGTEEYNIMLTERRGTSVLNYLADKGVAREALRVVAKGSLEAAGQSEAERAKDRRVEIVFE